MVTAINIILPYTLFLKPFTPFKQFGFARLRHIYILVRAMPATIAAAIASFQQIGICKNQVAIAVVIEINPLHQWLLHKLSGVPAVLDQY